VFGEQSVHVLTNGERPRPATAGRGTTETMDTLTETNELLQTRERLAAQESSADARDRLLRAAMAVPNNLQYLADGGCFASTVVDLVRAIGETRLAQNRTGVAYLHASAEKRAAWDAECAEKTRRDVAYLIDRLQRCLPA
jgi:hypothetical protein